METTYKTRDFPIPNDFQGSYAGRTDTIKTFHCDTHQSETSSAYIEGGYLITIHSEKAQLWSLQSALGFLIGIGNPMSNKDYMDYLNKIPEKVIDMLNLKFKEHGFADSNPLMFGVNNTMRLLPTNNGLFYLMFPDGTYELFSSLYDNPEFSDEFLSKHKVTMGNKVDTWLRKQFKFATEWKNKWKNVKSSLNKMHPNEKA